MQTAKTLLPLLLALLLAACACNSPPRPPSYQSGYADGCDAGYREAGDPYHQDRQDWTAYQTDRLYKRGWDEGRQVCFAAYDSFH